MFPINRWHFLVLVAKTNTTDRPVEAIHRFEAQALPVNAYLVETARGVVAVDGTLAVSDGRALRARVEALGKPLRAVLVTHAHPDHYAGIVELVAGDEVPILAVEGVDRIIRRDDAAKEELLRPMFGDEWPRDRTFPNRTVQDGETVTFDGARFRAIDLGPGESPHDSLWVLDGDPPRVFTGDLVYNRMHGYLADGHYAGWLENLDRARAMFADDAVFYLGHGTPGGPELLGWQAGYIRAFLDAVRAAESAEGDAATEVVTEAMRDYLPAEDLLFLMQLSVPPMREQLTH